MRRVGLTGGIGSGKSTVAAMLRLRGAALVDADAISRSLTAPGGAALAPLADRFGPAFITADGALDRDRMREASYADPQARKQLEAIIHPLVGLEIARQETSAIEAGHHCIVFDIPLLVESRRWRERVDAVLVIDCPTEVQIRRVMARSNLERVVVEKIVAAQVTREQRLHAADIVVCNDGDSIEALALKIEQLAPSLGL